MKRRSVLHAVGLTGVGGVAGCLRLSGSENGDKKEDGDREDGGCPAPSGDLVAVLPSGGEYEQQGDPITNDGGDDENVEQTALASYTGRDDERLLFGIAKYSSGTAAREEVTNATSQESQDRAFGYIIADNYVYFASGPDEESVKTLIANAKSLDSDCVDNNIEFL